MTLKATYEARIAAGAIERDPAQEDLLHRFERLARDIAAQEAARIGLVGRFFRARRTPEAVRGLYIHGEVGRGKTMLMDMFFECIEMKAKRRAHFHDFMADVHERIHAERQATGGKAAGGKTAGNKAPGGKTSAGRSGDPIPPVANALADEARLLCFDEFTVTDIADAMILGRLFAALFDRGVILVATSNTAPDNLYKDGLNRQLFLPFIDLLKARVKIVELNARTDFRLEKLAGAPVYHLLTEGQAEAALSDAFSRLAGIDNGPPRDLVTKGRVIRVPQAAGGVARFSFDDLCEQPLGAADYIRIARAFHTLVLDGIPVMGPEKRNAARRFVWLIDELYNHKVKLIASAQAEPHKLYVEGDFASEFERTASRLIEMRGTEYLAAAHGGANPADTPLDQLEPDGEPA